MSDSGRPAEGWSNWFLGVTGATPTYDSPRDLNPHLVAVDRFLALAPQARRFFVTGLADSARSVLSGTTAQQPGPPALMLALERHLHIITLIDHSSIRTPEIRDLCLSVLNLTERLSKVDARVLRRLAIGAAAAAGHRFAVSTLATYMTDPDLCITALTIGIRKHGVRVISRLFRSLIAAAVSRRDFTTLKLALGHLFALVPDDQDALLDSLGQLARDLPESEREALRSVANDLRLPISFTESTVAAIRRRRTLIHRAPTYAMASESGAYNTLIKEVVAEVRRSLDVDASPRTDELQWNLVMVELTEHTLDFLGDPYFLSDARRLGVQVIRIGAVDRFGCLYDGEGDLPAMAASLLDNESATPVEVLVTKVLNETRVIRFGLLGDTAATSYTLKAIASRAADLRESFEVPSRIRDLAGWYATSPRDRVLIADVGILHSIRNLEYRDIHTRAPNLTDPTWRDIKSRMIERATVFPYTPPLPVGIPFPIHDRAYRDVLRDALRRAVARMPRTWAWDRVRTELKSVSIEPYSEQEFYAGLDLAALLQLRQALSQFTSDGGQHTRELEKRYTGEVKRILAT